MFVRFYSKKLEDKLRRTIIIENKVGAFGNISTEYVARSKPDGYTLFVAPGSSFLAAAPSLFKKLAFDPVNDFEHVTTLSKLPFILIVSGDSPYRSVADSSPRISSNRATRSPTPQSPIPASSAANSIRPISGSTPSR